MVVDLSKLTSTSQELAAKSNEVNTLISGVEAKLQSLQLGFEAWLRSDPLIETIEPAPSGAKVHHTHVLGFSFMGGAWRLVTRTVAWTEYPGGKKTNPDEGNPTPLLQAPRRVRLEALGRLQALVDLMERQAGRMLDEIKKAQSAAEGRRHQS